jgi:hypothetical protein
MVSWRHALASVALVFLLLADGTDARVKAGVMAEEKRRRSLSSSGSSKTGDQEPSLSEAPKIVQWGYKNERGVKASFSPEEAIFPFLPPFPSFPDLLPSLLPCHRLNTQSVWPDLHPSTHLIHPIHLLHACIHSSASLLQTAN